MRVSEEKCPVLKWLGMTADEMRATSPIKHKENTRYSERLWKAMTATLVEEWDNMSNRCIKDINYITSPFMHSALKVNNIFGDKEIDSLFIEERISGVLIFSFAKGSSQVLYDFGDEYYTIAMFWGNQLALMVKGRMPKVLLSISVFDNEEKQDFFISETFKYIYTAILFKKYAKVETIYLEPKEKKKNPRTKEKHLNESNIPITMLDSTWFNNIVRDEPFGVKGHFRLQPKKNDKGQWIKELIYIKPFMKKGYNIKAKKEQL